MSDRTPAETLDAAADQLEKFAKKATPGPWWRPLNVRNKAVILAELPQDERENTWIGGEDPYTGLREVVGVLQVNIWSDGRHSRKRNGRDLEWAAMVNPLTAAPLARLLRCEAARVGKYQPRTQEHVVDPDWLELAQVLLAGIPPERR